MGSRKRKMGNRMPQMSRNRKLSRAVLCVFLGVALIVGGSAAVHAEDDDDSMWDVKVVKKFLRGFGLRNGQEAGIQYQERPPLVVPPSRDLPPPVASDSMAVRSAAWPTDPDEKRRAEERKSKSVKKRDPKTYNSEVAGDDRLMPDQLAQKSDKPSERTSDPTKPAEMTPSELGFTSSMWKSMVGLSKTFTSEKDVETGTFSREPSRNALTDPPAGYRTPAANQPYGINTKPDRTKAAVGDRQTDGMLKQ
jgi:hypothetical protein